MLPPPVRLLPAGDSAIVVEFGDGIDVRVNALVRRLHRALGAWARPGIVEAVPTYRSLMVHYDPATLGFEDVERLIAEAAGELPEDGQDAFRTVDIPVLYGGQAGPDLSDVAAIAGLGEQAAVDLHASGDYIVFMLGFMPGFPYLGGLSPRIATPRLSTPRTVVPAGSVGIAGQQTGIYPTESPGGWRLIGRTPIRLFDPLRSPPALLEAGDRVRFAPVSAAEYDAVARHVADGTYEPVMKLRGRTP